MNTTNFVSQNAMCLTQHCSLTNELPPKKILYYSKILHTIKFHNFTIVNILHVKYTTVHNQFTIVNITESEYCSILYNNKLVTVNITVFTTVY